MRPTHVVPDRGAPVTRIGLGRPTSGEVTTAGAARSRERHQFLMRESTPVRLPSASAAELRPRNDVRTALMNVGRTRRA